MNSSQQWQIVVKFNIPLFYRYFYNHLSNYTKTIIRLRLVNIPLDFVSGNIRQYPLRLRRIIVKYKYRLLYKYAQTHTIKITKIILGKAITNWKLVF